MRKQTIRKSVWETNSSSAHSLVIERSKYIDNPIYHKLDSTERREYLDAMRQKYREDIAKRRGIIKVRLGEYGWGYEELIGFEEKLSYICTDIIGYKIDEEDTEEDALLELEYAGLTDILHKELGVEQIELRNIHESYIDHQSIGLISGVIGCGYNHDKIIDFLVDDNLIIQIANDNSANYRLNEFVHITEYEGMDHEENVLMLENAPDWMKKDRPYDY